MNIIKVVVLVLHNWKAIPAKVVVCKPKYYFSQIFTFITSNIISSIYDLYTLHTNSETYISRTPLYIYIYVYIYIYNI